MKKLLMAEAVDAIRSHVHGRKNVVTMNWTEFHKFMGRERVRDSLVEHLRNELEAHGISVCSGESTIAFLQDSNFSPMTE